MKIDYQAMLPVVLERMFPDPDSRSRVQKTLERYGTEPYHSEVARVRLGILKLFGTSDEELECLVNLACIDYRDLLVSAEYPRTFELSLGEKEGNPELYERCRLEEKREYHRWLLSHLGDGAEGTEEPYPDIG